MKENTISFRPEFCGDLAATAGRELAAARFTHRIREKDHTLWKPEPTEIADRLGWLTSPWTMAGRLAEIEAVVNGVRDDGYEQVILLGMGGSSLAPEVFAKVFGRAKGFLDLKVLDSTDPGAVLARTEGLDLAKTLFIVATKSGGTVETFSLLRYCFNLTAERLGIASAGRHFLAITDPGSTLAELAKVHGFRHCFLNDPEIGGRYSVLSCFGLVPAALLGMDAKRFLARAAAAADQESAAGEGGPTGAVLGALIAEWALRGRDKLTFAFSPVLAPFGDWLEQLLAESTGKEGQGVLPVVGEPLMPAEAYGADRLFVSLRLAGDRTHEAALAALAAAGHPVCDLILAAPYDLGGQCFLWEMATAALCWRLKVNPFDQPDVEAAKVLARRMVEAYREEGSLPEEPASLATAGLSVYGASVAATPEAALDSLWEGAAPGAYLAIQAYLAPDAAIDAALQRLRVRLADRSGLAVTVGYGPRFLHSTGQLHKGDAGRGLFVQLTADDPREAPIPDRLGEPASSLGFGVLKAAQALGDRRALLDKGRRVLRLHFHANPAAALDRLADTL